VGGGVWRDLGRISYDEALELQRDTAQAKRDGVLEDDVLFLLEHPAVITHGRSSADVHVTASAEALREAGVVNHEIERGGDVTYHGPGQLVGYPVLDLGRYRRDLHWYLRSLEEVMIRTLGSLGLDAARAEGLTGVWVGEGIASATGDGVVPSLEATGLVRAGAIRKIASIGIHASRWITTHGFALNHTAESLAGFRWIVPCGIDGVDVTSIESEGCEVRLDLLKQRVVDEFESVFGVRLQKSQHPTP